MKCFNRMPRSYRKSEWFRFFGSIIKGFPDKELSKNINMRMKASKILIIFQYLYALQFQQILILTK